MLNSYKLFSSNSDAIIFEGPVDFTRDVVTYLIVVGTIVAVAFDGSVSGDGFS